MSGRRSCGGLLLVGNRDLDPHPDRPFLLRVAPLAAHVPVVDLQAVRDLVTDGLESAGEVVAVHRPSADANQGDGELACVPCGVASGGAQPMLQPIPLGPYRYLVILESSLPHGPMLAAVHLGDDAETGDVEGEVHSVALRRAASLDGEVHFLPSSFPGHPPNTRS